MKKTYGLRWRSAMNSYCKVETETGKFWVACGPNGITMIHPADQPAAAFEDMHLRRTGVKPVRGDIPASCIQAVRQAAAGRAFDAVPMDISCLGGFHRKVLKALQQVPRGEVRNYAWLARRVGNPKAARAVGNAMARNPIPILIPCHRVVPSTGGTGNYGLGKEMKRDLLRREGVDVDKL
jgi:methylated-DNA-[protein]-cysteine S-methyltransferase